MTSSLAKILPHSDNLPYRVACAARFLLPEYCSLFCAMWKSLQDQEDSSVMENLVKWFCLASRDNFLSSTVMLLSIIWVNILGPRSTVHLQSQVFLSLLQFSCLSQNQPIFLYLTLTRDDVQDLVYSKYKTIANVANDLDLSQDELACLQVLEDPSHSISRLIKRWKYFWWARQDVLPRKEVINPVVLLQVSKQLQTMFASYFVGNLWLCQK
jgi:hypothetical protein